jgi:hypothetical protein
MWFLVKQPVRAPAVAQATARTKVPAGIVANGALSGSETLEVLLISKFFHLLSGSSAGEFLCLLVL